MRGNELVRSVIQTLNVPVKATKFRQKPCLIRHHFLVIFVLDVARHLLRSLVKVVSKMVQSLSEKSVRFQPLYCLHVEVASSRSHFSLH